MRYLLAFALMATLFALSQSVLGQASSRQSEPCDKEMNFCWYDPYPDGSDEVEAWGDRWISQDKNEKNFEISSEIRCVKKLGVCMYASSQLVFGSKRITKIDLLQITRWDNNQITADGENASREPCDRDSYIINRGDHSVTMVSSPGPRAESSSCTAVMGKPKTVIYKLARE